MLILETIANFFQYVWVNISCIRRSRKWCYIIKWNVPRRTLTLKAFNLSCISKDNKISREFGIKMLNDSLLHSFSVDNLAPATEFTVSVTCLCIYEHLKTVSTKEEIQFITKPLPPQNLVLENQQCNSFTIKWESAVILG